MTRLSIGEFAQKSGLTPKALRLYDELGLLPPVHQELARVLTTSNTPQDAVDRCVELVRAAGAPDNLACLVVDAVADE